MPLRGVRSKCASVEEKLSRFGRSTQYDSAVAVAMRDDIVAGVHAGLGKEPKRQSQLAAWSDCQLGWFP
jgi:hypothetical protein